MSEPKTTLEVLETLTPHEAETLRKRFGVVEKVTNDTRSPLPTNGNESGGSGGTPAPATPQK